ncbi:RNA-binding RNA annealing protein [Vermiconidia calcicola]|uniref:RNA-binding RNA annealing protein n=1 Tax=Vermiconidia calcicola TaxID=1690605 RepID=A0ACC3M9K7_9PEZI|nr:RNA-binding RNA annealing protein [Vermiconidia calcicola]
MSGKLDQSLDQIMSDTKPAGGRGRGGARKPRPARNAKSKAKAAIAAPTAGVQKTRATTRAPQVTAPVLTASTSSESKIIVSNLPEDVTEVQVKDYFSQTVGNVKRAMLTYGPNGRSRGIATIVFRNGDGAQKAAKSLDGVKVDNKAMRIEVVLGAKAVPAPPAPKTLAARMSQPKSAANAKEKTKPKANGAAATTNGASKEQSTRGGRKAGRSGKPKKKTAEELDAEMMDYFGNEAAAAPATAQPVAAANGADAGMVDEVM